MATKPPMTVDIRNRLITTDVPNNGDALIYDASGNVWKPGPVSGSPSGSAGGDLAGTYPDPSVAGIRGVPVESGTPAHGDALLYDSGAGELRYAPPTSAGALPTPTRVGQSVWWDGLAWRAGDSLVTPGTPHPDDDEFEGGLLDSAWTRRSGYASSDIDFLRSDSSGSWWDSHNALRKSWYLIQSSPGGNAGGIMKPHSLSTDEAIYVRFSANRGSAINIANGRVDLVLTNSAITDYVIFNLNRGSTNSAGGRIAEQRSSGPPASPVAVNFSDYPYFEYAHIQKLGNAFSLWLSENGKTWVYIGSLTPNGSLSNYTHVLIQIANNSADPVNLVGGFDFIRFRPGITQGVP